MAIKQTKQKFNFGGQGSGVTKKGMLKANKQYVNWKHNESVASETNLEYRGRDEARLRGRARGDRGDRGERGERGERGDRGERWLRGERGVRERGDREPDCARRRSSSLRFARISFSRIIRLNASRGSSAALWHNFLVTLHEPKGIIVTEAEIVEDLWKFY